MFSKNCRNFYREKSYPNSEFLDRVHIQLLNLIINLVAYKVSDISNFLYILASHQTNRCILDRCYLSCQAIINKSSLQNLPFSRETMTYTLIENIAEELGSIRGKCIDGVCWGVGGIVEALEKLLLPRKLFSSEKSHVWAWPLLTGHLGAFDNAD